MGGVPDQGDRTVQTQVDTGSRSIIGFSYMLDAPRSRAAHRSQGVGQPSKMMRKVGDSCAGLYQPLLRASVSSSVTSAIQVDVASVCVGC